MGYLHLLVRLSKFILGLPNLRSHLQGLRRLSSVLHDWRAPFIRALYRHRQSTSYIRWKRLRSLAVFLGISSRNPSVQHEFVDKLRNRSYGLPSDWMGRSIHFVVFCAALRAWIIPVVRYYRTGDPCSLSAQGVCLGYGHCRCFAVSP